MIVENFLFFVGKIFNIFFYPSHWRGSRIHVSTTKADSVCWHSSRMVAGMRRSVYV